MVVPSPPNRNQLKSGGAKSTKLPLGFLPARRRTQVSKHITDLEARLGQAKEKFKEVTDQEAEALHNLKVSLDEQCGLQAQLVAAQHDGSIPAGLLPAATSTGLEGPLQRLATIDGIDAWAEKCEQAVKLGAGAIDIQVGQLREKLLSQHQTLLSNATRKVIARDGEDYRALEITWNPNSFSVAK